MNQYPLWKYLLILAVLLAGLITLCEFLRRIARRTGFTLRASLKADAALLGRVGNILNAAALVPETSALEGNSVKARLPIR